MPGPVKQPTLDGATPKVTPVNAASLIRRAGATAVAEIPDPAPYQAVKKIRLKGADGSTLEIDDTRWASKAKLMQWLSICPAVMVSIPLDPSNDPEDTTKTQNHYVGYDGYPFYIPKGEPVEVPAPIAEIVRQSQQKYRTAQARGLDLLTISPKNPNGMYVDFGDGGDPMAATGAAFSEE